MPVDIGEIRGWILGLVTGIILTVAGAVMVNVLYSIGNYITAQVINATSVGGTQTMLVSPQQIQIVGLALMMAGITLVVISVAMMIKVIIESIPK